jgi:hypothetical protein
MMLLIKGFGIKMGQYKTEFKNTSSLTAEETSALAGLYLSYYSGTDGARFEADLGGKDEILLVTCDEVLVGFTTLQVYERQWRGECVRVIYSGDTVVEQAHWGQQALAFAWIARMGEIKRERPDVPLYWLLIVKGHRTFKYLPTFGKTFFPHWSQDRSDLKPLADFLAREKFGSDYNAGTGVVEFPVSHGHLRHEIAFPTDEQMNQPAVKFFVQRNPGFTQGHELVCLCEMEETNMRPLTRRIFNKDVA